MISVLVVEDEFTIALDIRERLIQMGHDTVNIASDYNKALPFLFDNSPDIVLLDINLGKGKSGIDLAKLINEKLNIPFIFLTAYSDDSNFEKAQKTHPMGFIIKPFKDKDLDHGIKLALKHFEEIARNKSISGKENNNSGNLTDLIFVKDKGQIISVKKSDIFWLEAMDNYTVIHKLKKKYIVNSFLKDVLLSLNSENFFRIHKSHAVAIDKITKIEDNLIFIGDIYLIISRKYKKELLEKLNLL